MPNFDPRDRAARQGGLRISSSSRRDGLKDVFGEKEWDTVEEVAPQRVPKEELEDEERELNAEPERAVRAGRRLYEKTKEAVGPSFEQSEPDDPRETEDKPYPSQNHAVRDLRRAFKEPDIRASVEKKSKLAPVFINAAGDGSLGEGLRAGGGRDELPVVEVRAPSGLLKPWEGDGPGRLGGGRAGSPRLPTQQLPSRPLLPPRQGSGEILPPARPLPVPLPVPPIVPAPEKEPAGPSLWERIFGGSPSAPDTAPPAVPRPDSFDRNAQAGYESLPREMQEEIDRLPEKERERARRHLGVIGAVPRPVPVSKEDLTRDDEEDRPKILTMDSSRAPDLHGIEVDAKGPMLSDEGYGVFLTYDPSEARRDARHKLAELLKKCQARRAAGEDCHIVYAKTFAESGFSPTIEPVALGQNRSHGQNLNIEISRERVAPGERAVYRWRPSLFEE